MKRISTLILTLTFFSTASAQQMLCDFEGAKVMYFGYATGSLDTMAVNTDPDAANMTTNCARYIRDTTMYDFIKMYPEDKFVDVAPYASNNVTAPKIKIKLWSSAPVGTMLTMQLGSKADDSYPGGVHSEYVAATTVQNGWQTISFNYWQSGMFTSSTTVDKMVLLFNPGFNTTDTLMVDDIMGPPVLVVSNVASHEGASLKLFQNSPNPVKGNTNIGFQLNSSGNISLKLYDMLGNPVKSLVDQQYMKPGSYSIPVNTDDIHSGIYFYVLKKDGVERSMKMIVSK